MSRKLILATGLAGALAFLAAVPSASAQVILPLPRVFIAPALTPAVRAPVYASPATPVIAAPVNAAPVNVAPPSAETSTSFYRSANGQTSETVWISGGNYYTYPTYYRRAFFFRRW